MATKQREKYLHSGIITHDFTKVRVVVFSGINSVGKEFS